MVRPSGAGTVWELGHLDTVYIQVSNATSTGLAIEGNPGNYLVLYGGTDNLVHEGTWHP